MIDTNKLKKFFNLLVEENRRIILPYFRNKLEVISKADKSPVTAADKDSEKNIRSLISKYYPEHNIQGEEFPKKVTQSSFKWVIDPIDGTRSFISGKPSFGTLVGLYENNTPLAGLIDMPALKESWLGFRNGGAYLNNIPIKTRKIKSISLATIACTSPNMFNERQLNSFKKVETECNNVVWGGDCHNFALLAGGYLDIVVEHNLSWHDVAAVIPIIEAAGGYISDWKGKKINEKSNGSVIASGDEKVQSEVLKILG